VYTRVNAVEWAVPVLYLRSPDGSIFDVAAAPPAERPQPLPPPEAEALPTAPPIDRTRSPVVAAASPGKGGPGPAARRRLRGGGVAALVALAAAALLVAGIQIWGGDRGVETAANGGSPGPAVQTDQSPDAAKLLASFETGTEGWAAHPDTPDIGSTSKASDFATDGDFSLQVDPSKAGFFGTEFARPIDLSGKSAVRVDVETVVSELPKTKIAIQLDVRERSFWCGSDNLDATGTVTLDFATMRGPDCRPRPSDLTEVTAVWLYLNEGSYRVDNVRAE
jgi:hypothetical protein